MRRLLPLSLATAAVALAASGCGASSSSDPLDSALSYMPKNSPVAFAINTDLNSDQAKQLGKLIRKVPQSDRIIQSIEHSIASSSGANFDKDIKPLLGNDLVVAIPTAQDLQRSNSPTVEAIKTKDGGKAKALVAKGATKVGSSHGADIYKDNRAGNFTAVEGDTVVGADTRPLLEAALARHDGGDHMTKDDFDSALGDLSKDAIVRGTGDLQSILAGSSGTDQARKVKWVNALRDLGFTVEAKDNSLAVDVEAKTEGGLKDSDLPIASGTSSAPVVKRPGEINLGLRDPAQIYTFIVGALQSTDPQQFGQFEAGKQQIERKLGVNVDKDIVGQLQGNSAVSVGTDGGYAARFDLKDPAAFKASLAKVADGLPELAKQFGGGPIGISKPKGGKGFYAIAGRGHKKTIFGVVGNEFVAASDAKRIAAFATQSTSPVPGAQGAVAMDIATRALVNQQLQQRGVNPLAQALTGFLGDLTGYLRADTSNIRANFTLQLNG